MFDKEVVVVFLVNFWSAGGRGKRDIGVRYKK